MIIIITNIITIVMTSPAGRAVLQHVVHGLVHGPALGVHPRVHHQAARAEYVCTQVTEPVAMINYYYPSDPEYQQQM